ncbi:MAG: SpoIID/LytB domain-containing protein, partial [Dictyoglomaceae bacterium]|nr:SpoIID/LytB domain-containing protein [Dictyoglomaceae bacterium]
KIDKEINLTRVGEIINSHTKVEVEGNGSFTLKIERENAILNFGKDILILTLPILLYPQKNKLIAVNSMVYRGIMEINENGWIINILNLEDYLMGVIPAEMPLSYPLEALKAQTVSSRTYALSSLGRHRIFDLCANVHCQVYKGVNFEREKTNMAVRETMGEVITYNGQLIKAFYHSSSGGITENSEDVWGGYYPYLRSVKDVEELNNDTWVVILSLEEIKGKLTNFNATFQEIFTMELEKSSTGRVKNVIIRSNIEDFLVKGTLWREIFNLPSTLFDIKFENNSIYILGRGMGHGVGLSQKGARFLAEKGYNYRDIIKYYYQGVEVQKWY